MCMLAGLSAFVPQQSLAAMASSYQLLFVSVPKKGSFPFSIQTNRMLSVNIFNSVKFKECFERSYPIAEHFRGRKLRGLAENQVFRGFNFAICVCIVRVCVQRFRVFAEGWLSIDIRLLVSSLWSSSSFPKEQWATWPHFVLISLQSDSQYFLVL